jgi:uroporphyrinogen decarboxylase
VCSKLVGGRKAVQGNLDPIALFGSRDSVRDSTAAMLRGFSGHPHIANLGHGMMPTHTPEQLKNFLDAVCELSVAATP